MSDLQKQIVIIGGGAAGLFCAGLLGKAGFNVTVLDNGKKLGRKILMSGGGFCNFTNLNIDSNCYLSQNAHFCKSAIKRFTQWDFLALINQYNIEYYEKELGQLFCKNGAKEIVNMLLDLCHKANVSIKTAIHVLNVQKNDDLFYIETDAGTLKADAVIVATGGLSMPKLGTTPIGYKIANHFGLNVVPVRAGLVPFTLSPEFLSHFAELSGIAVFVEASVNDVSFTNNMLFTHRGLSGPVMLQLSNYWQTGDAVTINFLSQIDLKNYIHEQKLVAENQHLKTCLSYILPKRLIEVFIKLNLIEDKPLKQLTEKQIDKIVHDLSNFQIIPNGTEGYRTAEITLGGIDTNELSSKTMQANLVKHLYFIGEVVDVNGWLGGYNFQWAWSSAYACASEFIKQHSHEFVAVK